MSITNEHHVRSLALGALRLLGSFLLVFWVTFWAAPLFGPILPRLTGYPSLLAVAVATVVTSLGYLVFYTAPWRMVGRRVPAGRRS